MFIYGPYTDLYKFHIHTPAHPNRALLNFIVYDISQQTETTKGTGGDIIILEEAAYVDSGFFYETVAPLMIVGTTTLIGISTLRDGVNFYTRLIRHRDKATGLPMFTVLQVQLACEKCKEDGKATDCVHMLHLVPRWQSSDKHVKLKTIMQDRPGELPPIQNTIPVYINHSVSSPKWVMY